MSPGHQGEGQNHDVYIELIGPSAVDVHHNFVQRWNEASERHLIDGRWGPGSETNLPFPNRVPPRQGNAIVQIQRTIHSGRHVDGHASPGGLPFDISAGERSNFEQYLAAIDGAQSTIYIENQYIDVPQIIDGLRLALQRGVTIVAVVPAEGKVSEELRSLGTFEKFTLAGLAGLGEDGKRKPVWVHAKLMIVDGEWGTVGSCNLHRYSLFGNCEINAAFWDRDTARALLSELLQEHLATDTARMDDHVALELFRSIAEQNRQHFEADEHAWQGIAFSLLPPPIS